MRKDSFSRPPGATLLSGRDISFVLSILCGWIIAKHTSRPGGARDEVHPRIVVSRKIPRDVVMPEIEVAQWPGEALSMSRSDGRHESSRLLQRPVRLRVEHLRYRTQERRLVFVKHQRVGKTEYG